MVSHFHDFVLYYFSYWASYCYWMLYVVSLFEGRCVLSTCFLLFMCFLLVWRSFFCDRLLLRSCPWQNFDKYLFDTHFQFYINIYFRYILTRNYIFLSIFSYFRFSVQKNWYPAFKTVISENSENGSKLSKDEKSFVLNALISNFSNPILDRFLERWNNTGMYSFLESVFFIFWKLTIFEEFEIKKSFKWSVLLMLEYYDN